MIDLPGISLKRSKGKRFRSDSGCDINIDLSAQFTERYYKLLVFSHSYLSADLSSLLSRNIANIVYGVIVSVGFEDRIVLLCIDSFNS